MVEQLGHGIVRIKSIFNENGLKQFVWKFPDGELLYVYKASIYYCLIFMIIIV